MYKSEVERFPSSYKSQGFNPWHHKRKRRRLETDACVGKLQIITRRIPNTNLKPPHIRWMKVHLCYHICTTKGLYGVGSVT